MKIFDGLKLHPNGFLGAPVEFRDVRVKKPVQVDLIGTAARRITLESEENALTANKEVDDLFKEITSHEGILERNFEFRERLFSVALKAFGTRTIDEWIDKQKQNPYFDTMQNRFVEEMVGYVFTGFRRYHSAIYLDILDIGTHNAFTIGPNVGQYLRNRSGNDVMSIRDFLQKWLSQRDGLSDLAITLRVLFGS